MKSKLFKAKRLFLFVLAFMLCYTLPYTTFYLSFKPTSSSTATIILHPQLHQEDRYLAYLPHSGLSNQRIELANALLLAYMLNRTLIIPPAFLGTVFGWMNRDQLLDKLEWLTTPKDFQKLCQQPTPGRLSSYVQRSKCAEYRHFGVIPWTELHDLDLLQSLGIKFILQETVSMETLKNQLNITNDQDIYIHQDAQLYDWRLYENHTEAVELLYNKSNFFDSFAGRRYYKVLLPRHFQRRTEKLVYLGGIFGSTRLNLIDPEHIAVQEKIKKILHYRMDTPLGKTVQSIVDHLGGKGTFMSVHFRTGDNPFRKEVPQNLQAFLKNMTLLVQNETYVDSTVSCLSMQQGQNYFDSDTYHRAKVYIATDHRDPRARNSQLLPWFDAFPCTTVLNDLPQYLFTTLDSVRDIIEPSKSLKSFLIPLVDAMVAAHAKQILTTPRSTFSKYIDELHQSWIPS